jgi:hypothetical protein
MLELKTIGMILKRLRRNRKKLNILLIEKRYYTNIIEF